MRAIILLTIFNTFSLSSMEPQRSTQKKSSKELIRKKSKSFLRKISNEKIDEKSAMHTTELEHPFIMAAYSAIYSRDYTTIQFYLRNPHFNPNTPDLEGYSALQIFIKEKAYQGIELLLTDYRVHFKYEDLYKKDIHQRPIFDYIDKKDEKLKLLRHKIFARFTLDMITDQKCKKIESFYTYGLLTRQILTEVIQKIKNHIQQDAIKQSKQQEENDQNPVLPELACLPDYATNEFIEKRIWFILSLPHT